jgi:hypothetical protein
MRQRHGYGGDSDIAAATRMRRRLEYVTSRHREPSRGVVDLPPWQAEGDPDAAATRMCDGPIRVDPAAALQT